MSAQQSSNLSATEAKMLGGGGFLAKVYFEVKLTTTSPSSDIQIVVFHSRLLPEHLSFLVMPFYFSQTSKSTWWVFSWAGLAYLPAHAVMWH